MVPVGCRPGDVEDEDRDEADAWYAACTDIALAELTRSNFYTEVYECCSDRAGLGTGRYTAVRGRTGGCCLSPFSLSIAAGCGMKMAGWWCLSGEMLLSAYDVADLFGAGSLKGKVKGRMRREERRCTRRSGWCCMW